LTVTRRCRLQNHGHSKPSVTMNVYAHASIEMQSEAAQLMENLITPIPISLEEIQKEDSKM